MSELANILGVSAAAVSQMIAGFEKKGLLKGAFEYGSQNGLYSNCP